MSIKDLSDIYLMAFEVIKALHTEWRGNCVECSRIICLGTPNGLGSIQYPCMTILCLEGVLNAPN